jgi:hypothetical protein
VEFWGDSENSISPFTVRVSVDFRGWHMTSERPKEQPTPPERNLTEYPAEAAVRHEKRPNLHIQAGSIGWSKDVLDRLIRSSQPYPEITETT